MQSHNGDTSWWDCGRKPEQHGGRILEIHTHTHTHTHTHIHTHTHTHTHTQTDTDTHTQTDTHRQTHTHTHTHTHTKTSQKHALDLRSPCKHPFSLRSLLHYTMHSEIHCISLGCGVESEHHWFRLDLLIKLGCLWSMRMYDGLDSVNAQRFEWE